LSDAFDSAQTGTPAQASAAELSRVREGAQVSDDRAPRVCPHCGSLGMRRIGYCKVCNLTVCEHCGNVQYAGGQQEPMHNDCLRNAGDTFSMIKFVK
jgi:ribosomal protein L37AE/L43A